MVVVVVAVAAAVVVVVVVVVVAVVVAAVVAAVAVNMLTRNAPCSSERLPLPAWSGGRKPVLKLIGNH